MIYTITFNPSLDYVVEVDSFELGKINRTRDEDIFIGGKGINVSRVLNNLGIKSVPLGFIAGFTGNELEDKLRSFGINSNFIKVSKGITRINVKIKGSRETAINANGPLIEEDDIRKLFDILNSLTSEDFVVLAGNVPSCVDSNIYADICDLLNRKQIKFIVDATGKLLYNSLKYRPFLVKPNREELEELLSVKINSFDDLVNSVEKVKELGAYNVLVSLGGDGAYLSCFDGTRYGVSAPKVRVINTVGAGDSMIAGFLYGYLKNNDYLSAIKYGVACGSATASCNDLATKDVIEEIYNMIN